ncbi:hypothetical protein PRIPAC_87582 [Pristionchus pacificus]|uniref:Zinc finger protein n=1 Tax=Pristionchus pacificus TaxID=54126 RepID=A0A2A6CXF4_PRIPA|nr:hypothetical protein PRIPAC_87582 [Pristionchus pacificus]|eukprot:PDM82766.1 zinc finger protein [Pristionchus pacificus]
MNAKATGIFSSSDSLIKLVQTFINLMNDFINSEADPKKLVSIRTSFLMEQRYFHECDSRMGSKMCDLIFDLSDALAKVIEWVGTKEKTLKEEHPPRNYVKKDSSEGSDHSLFIFSDEDDFDTDCENTEDANENENRKKRITKSGKNVSPVELQCQICEKQFATKKQMQNHNRIHTAKEAFESGLFKCELCGKCFRTKQNLSVHKTTHLEDEAARKHRCNVCGNLFTQFTHLKEHQRIHLADEAARKPHACDTCGKRFTQSSHLREHKKTHLRKIQIYPDIKALGLQEETSLGRGLGSSHSMIQVGDTRRVAQADGRGFSKLGMEESEEDETSRKPHICDICERRFSQAAHLRKHKMTHLN